MDISIAGEFKYLLIIYRAALKIMSDNELILLINCIHHMVQNSFPQICAVKSRKNSTTMRLYLLIYTAVYNTLTTMCSESPKIFLFIANNYTSYSSYVYTVYTNIYSSTLKRIISANHLSSSAYLWHCPALGP